MSQRRQRRWLGTLLQLSPPLLVLGVLYLGALVTVLLQSFGYAPLYGVDTFPTFRYYRAAWAAPDFWRSLALTLRYAFVPTVLGTVLSVYLALLLRPHLPKMRGYRLVSVLYKLPLMVPYLVGVALTLLLWSNGGLIARLLFAFGLIETTNDFPRLLHTTGGIGVMLVYLWKQVPFQTLLLTSVLAGQDPNHEAAAALLGAKPRQVFWLVTLPRLVPGIVSATLIVFAFNFGAFEVPLILGGEPNTLPVAVWRAFSDADTERRLYGAAIAVVVCALLSVLLLGYLLLYRALERRWGRV